MKSIQAIKSIDSNLQLIFGERDDEYYVYVSIVDPYTNGGQIQTLMFEKEYFIDAVKSIIKEKKEYTIDGSLLSDLFENQDDNK